jgi:hypothetical protein
MHATTMPCPRSDISERFNTRQAPGSNPARVTRADIGSPSSKPDDELQRRYRHTLQALGDARERAARAERRLRSRFVELTWPAALGGIAGGVAAIVGLWLAGM